LKTFATDNYREGARIPDRKRRRAKRRLFSII